MDDYINGETTDDGLQETYERALFTLVMTHFEPGEVPAMVQRAYLGDDVMPDWETTDVTGRPVRLCPAHQIATGTDGTCYRCHENERAHQQHEQPAILIPVRHQAAAVPAWRKALIQVLAAGIARLA